MCVYEYLDVGGGMLWVASCAWVVSIDDDNFLAFIHAPM